MRERTVLCQGFCSFSFFITINVILVFGKKKVCRKKQHTWITNHLQLYILKSRRSAVTKNYISLHYTSG